jgi:hypothetical protein
VGRDTGWCAGLELNGDGGSASSLAHRGRDRDGAMDACLPAACKQCQEIRVVMEINYNKIHNLYISSVIKRVQHSNEIKNAES